MFTCLQDFRSTATTNISHKYTFAPKPFKLNNPDAERPAGDFRTFKTQQEQDVLEQFSSSSSS